MDSNPEIVIRLSITWLNYFAIGIPSGQNQSLITRLARQHPLAMPPHLSP